MTSSARAGEEFPDGVAAKEPATDGAGGDGGGSDGGPHGHTGGRMEDDHSSSSSEDE